MIFFLCYRHVCPRTRDSHHDIRVQSLEDDYPGQDGAHPPFNRVDNVAQTVNYFADCVDAECQTCACPTTSAGSQVHGFEVADAYGGRPPKWAGDGWTSRFDTTVMFLERVLARNVLGVEWPTSADGSHPDVRIDLAYRFALTLWARTEGPLSVGHMHWNEAAPHLCAVGYVRRPNDKAGTNAVAVWNIRNACNPER